MSIAPDSTVEATKVLREPSRATERLRPLGWAIFAAGALAFALFIRVTLYSRSGLIEMGIKGLVLPVLVVVALLLWLAVATFLIGRASPAATASIGVGEAGSASGGDAAARSRLAHRAGLFLAPFSVSASFLPLLATVPTILGVLGSEAYAQAYWIDRSVKAEMILGLPATVLALQVGIWVWYRYSLTWRTAGPALAVLVGAFALRYAGMGWGLPFAYQPEETSIYFRWANEVALHGQWNPHYFQNPSLLIYVLGVEFMGVYGLCRVLQFATDPGGLYMVFRGEQDLFYMVGRMNSVLLGAATVLAVYLLARRWWGNRAGLIAGALLAVNFLHVRNSQYGVNDVPSTFFLVLSFYFAARIAEEGRWREYLLAGLMAGLAASTKYNAGMIVVSIAVAHLLFERGRIKRSLGTPQARTEGPGLRTERKGQLSPQSSVPSPPLWAGGLRLGGAAVASLAGFVAGTPFSVLDFAGFKQGFLEQLGMGQSAWSGQQSVATVWLYTSGILQGAGVAAVALALLGTALLLIRDRGRAALVLSFPVFYLGFMSAMLLFFVRWAVPAMPFVALLAAYGLDQLVGLVPTRRRELAAASLAVLALLQPAVYSVQLDRLVHRTDTREIANGWAELNIPAGSKVAIEAYSILDQEALTFRPTLQQLDVELDWRATMHDLDYYRQNFDYLAISSWMYDRAFESPDKYADRVEFYQQLDKEFPLVASFYPRNDGTNTPFDLDDLDTPFWYLFSYDRPGPTVKVYRLSR